MFTIMPCGSQCIFDNNGTLRLRAGDRDVEPIMTYMLHLTKDGQYVTGIDMNGGTSHTNAELSKIRTTYADCHGWAMSMNSWFNIPAVGLGHARWDGSNAADVPECVRVAELLR